MMMGGGMATQSLPDRSEVSFNLSEANEGPGQGDTERERTNLQNEYQQALAERELLNMARNAEPP